jgi:ABC-type phosphate/phosphonate transport system substrate-binding protein
MYPDIKTLFSAFDKGEIDGFFSSPLQYLARKDNVSKILIGVGYKNADIKQSFLVIARASDSISQLKELRNKRISLAEYMDIEKLYLNTRLLRLNLPQVTEFFSEMKNPSNPHVALMDVFFNKSDIAIVREHEYNTAVELNPQLAKKLIILEKSEPYVSTVGTINNKIPDKEFTAAIETFNAVANTEKGLALLSIVSLDRVEILHANEVKNLEALVEENAALLRSQKASLITPVKVKPSDFAKASLINLQLTSHK